MDMRYFPLTISFVQRFLFLLDLTLVWYPRSHLISVDREMSKSGALDLATGVGGKIKKEDVQSAVDQYVSLLILSVALQFQGISPHNG
ncbi:hypothetical protein BHM03_00005387 [Ensete ventricosum]|nr:hypothetical protein BHM03_00005387 [Ensete ventricosum]